MQWIFDYQIWAGLITLTGLEIVLGVDNVIFIALIVSSLPPKMGAKARTLGLILAMVIRILFLLCLAWVIGLTKPLVNVWGLMLSGKDLLMLLGGLFLIIKATGSIHEEITHDRQKEFKNLRQGFAAAIAQIVLIDFIFSFDSVITAVGLTPNIPVIIAAMVIAMLVMIFSSGMVSGFINRYPTLKILALAFILIIGLFLVVESFGIHVPRGYIYFAMLFSLAVEMLNIKSSKKVRG
ncbi:MAG: TerC family protein [Alphaproteobacteria bacterium]|nr:TerC family protein [Alphaproteobacteria bacterium]